MYANYQNDSTKSLGHHQLFLRCQFNITFQRLSEFDKKIV